MKLADFYHQYLCLVILFGMVSVNCSEVPVLIWTNVGDIAGTLEEVSAGSHMSSSDFSRNYVDKLLNPPVSVQTLVVFVQDKLSIEDFTKYGSAYGSSATPAYRYLKGIVGGGGVSSVFLPSVTSPTPSLHEYGERSRGWTVSTIKSPPYELGEGEAGRRVAFIYMPRIGDDVEEGIRRNDEIVESVMLQLEEAGQQYIALYTGLKPSHLQVLLAHDRLRRDVGDDEVNNSTTFFNHSSCIFLYSEQITFHVFADTEVVLPLDPSKGSVEADSRCANSSDGGQPSLHIKYDGMGALKNLELFFAFDLSAPGYWQVSGVNITFDYAGNETVAGDGERLLVRDWSAPVSWSYHCDTTPVFRVSNTSSASSSLRDEAAVGVGIRFVGLQLQPVGLVGEKFGRAYDCQVFFTPAILMGIVVAVLLIGIFASGMAMIMNLKTNDRFDDPKGKSISVPQASD